MSGKPRIRCAIYTRKSSDEGLEQAFNSLDAQHEACAAYVASQKHEGWTLLKDRYDDGGISGGTLERPAIQRLLADIDAGRVDRVVVYKVDRLTRSLADFAKLVDRFDRAGASFVSVTQSFNTATSMGRLTLNVLLSFAQFEREVTAERIRDKIAASKKKGMWMGGSVPLGYDAANRTLSINQSEAEVVRTLFDLYREHGSIRAVKEEADRRGLRTKRRANARGSRAGGASFSRGHIHAILANPVYAGRIRHKDQVYDGAQEALIDPDVWEDVQQRLGQMASRPRGSSAVCATSPLAGKLHDETGDRLTPSHANKKGRRYRYYISNRLITKNGTPDPTGWRLPAEALERAIAEAIAGHVRAPTFPIDLLREPSAAAIEHLRPRLSKVAERLTGDERPSMLTKMVERVEVAPARMAISIAGASIAHELDVAAETIDASSLTFSAPVGLRRRGVEMRIALGTEAADPDEAFVRGLGKANTWFTEIKTGASIASIAEREAVSRQRINQVLRLAFLAPDLVADIIAGRQPAGLTMDKISRARQMDLWTHQRAWVAGLAD